MRQRLKLVPLTAEELRYDTEGYERWTNTISTPGVAPKSIDERPTLVHLKAFEKSSSPASSFMDALEISEKITWLMPALTDVSTKSKLEEGNAEPQGQSKGVEGHASLVRNLAKSSAIYAIPSFVGPLVTLVLAPFLTRNMSHTEYGALAVLTTAIALMAGITQFGMNAACVRAYKYDYEALRDRLSVIANTATILLLTSVLTTSVVILAAPFLATLLLNSPSLSDGIKLAALVVFMQNLTIPGLSWLRAENRALLFAVLSSISLLLNMVTNLFLVGVLHMGLAGSLLATGAGFTFIVICTMPIVFLRAGIGLRFDIVRNLLSFGLPLVSNFVSVWILQLSDRYLLGRLGSLAQTASYSVAYTLGSALAIIITPFLLAWPPAMFSIAKREDAAAVFKLVFRWFSLVLLFATFGLSLVSFSALYLLFPPEYHSAAPVIPIVAVSVMFFGIYNLFTVGVSVQRKTWYAVVFTTLSGLLNIGLNIILIPLYGSMGAAASTLAAYAFLVLIAYIVNQRIYPVPFEIGLFLRALLIGVVLFTLSSIFAQTQGLYGACAIYLCNLILYGGCLVLFAKFPMWLRMRKCRSELEDSIS